MIVYSITAEKLDYNTYLCIFQANTVLDVSNRVVNMGFLFRQFIPIRVGMRNETFDMSLPQTAAGFCHPLGQSVLLQKPVPFHLVLCHCPRTVLLGSAQESKWEDTHTYILNAQYTFLSFHECEWVHCP
jgi:hypothetical protein